MVISLVCGVTVAVSSASSRVCTGANARFGGSRRTAPLAGTRPGLRGDADRGTRCGHTGTGGRHRTAPIIEAAPTRRPPLWFGPAHTATRLSAGTRRPGDGHA